VLEFVSLIGEHFSQALDYGSNQLIGPLNGLSRLIDKSDLDSLPLRPICIGIMGSE
jgi:hypothetical protein